MFSEPAIDIQNLGKSYQMYDKPHQRLLKMLWRGCKAYGREFWALKGLNFQVMPGEVVGIIGRNGSGKSTLLQLVCGTLRPTTGQVAVRGRIAALLELGAGFNPEFTGRENVFLSAMISGMSQQETIQKFEDIVDFSGIRDFIDQPVKTYSSGMYVRLAFSIAINVDPDILVIDEALSVGDGEFARKSFDRIMELKKRGTTILFCSHSLYQVETLCSRVLWLEHGCARDYGEASSITAAYQAALDGNLAVAEAEPVAVEKRSGGYLKEVVARVGDVVGKQVRVVSLKDSLSVSVSFRIDPKLPQPSIALGISNESGITVSSVTSAADNVLVPVDSNGEGQVTVFFPRIALMKGIYYMTVFLACENALHIYDVSEHCLTLLVVQEDSLQGIVALAHEWQY